MKKWIFLFVLLVGCTKNQIVCDIETTAVNAITPTVATMLQCSNSDAIKESLTSWLNTGNFCSNSKMATGKDKLNSTLCAILTSTIMSAASGTIPSAWGCSAANAQNLLSVAINKACQNL